MKIFIIAAVSADGFIGRKEGEKSTKWTSAADAAWFQQRTQQAGAVVMGRSTYQTIGRPLAGRLNIIYSRQVTQPSPQTMALSPDYQLVIDSQLPTFDSRSVTIVNKPPTTSSLPITSLCFTFLSVTDLVRRLSDKGYSELAVCGGSSIYTSFIKSGLVTTVFLTIEPVIFGQGIGLFNEPLEIKLSLRKREMLSEQTMMLEYEVISASHPL